MCIRDRGNVSTASEILGINRNALYEWRTKDKKFATDWDRIKEEANELLVYEAENALLKGIRSGNATLIIFTLKNRDPERWGDKMQHAGKGGSAIEHQHTVSPEFAKFLVGMGYGK